MGLRRAFPNTMTWSICSSRKPQHFLSSRWTSAAARCAAAWKAAQCSTGAHPPTAEMTATCANTILPPFQASPVPLRQYPLPLLTCSAGRCTFARSDSQQRVGEPLSSLSRRTSAPSALASAVLSSSRLAPWSGVPSASSSLVAAFMLLCSRSCSLCVWCLRLSQIDSFDGLHGCCGVQRGCYTLKCIG